MLMAPVLAEYADAPVDMGRVIGMVLIHDIVEIDAGDTYCYDADGNFDKTGIWPPEAKTYYEVTS